jgi:hypothetical protein
MCDSFARKLSLSPLGLQMEFSMVRVQAIMRCDSRGYVANVLFSV